MNNSTRDSEPSLAGPPRPWSPADFVEHDGYVEYVGRVPLDPAWFDWGPHAEDDDARWAVSDPEVRRQYAGLVVAVCRRRVWGTGHTEAEAAAAARQHADCPDPDDLLYVVV